MSGNVRKLGHLNCSTTRETIDWLFITFHCTLLPAFIISLVATHYVVPGTLDIKFIKQYS